MKTTVVKVQFHHSFDRQYTGEKKYDYKAFESYSVGDLVVVETQYGYAVATVTDINVIAEPSRYVVQKVDIENLENMKLKAFELEVLKSQIDAEIEAMSYEARVAQFAEKNETLKELLEEYKKLKGDN